MAVALAVVGAPARATADEPGHASPTSGVAPPTALVHIQADAAASLELFEPRRPSTTWRLVCDAPCDAAVPLGSQYVIDSEGKKSEQFTLQATAGRRELLTVTGSRDARDWGDFLAAMGFLTTVLGGATVVATVACRNQGEVPCRNDGGWEAAGAVAAGAGVAMLASGILLWSKGEVRVKHSVSTTTQRALPSASNATALLAPTGGGATLPPLPVKPVILPILSGRF